MASLQDRVPAQALKEQLLNLRSPSPSRLYPLEQGITGEEATAKVLEQLGPEYRVLHSIPIPGQKKDIDHLVIGPTGVFLINTKHYAGARVLIDAEYLIYGKRRYTDPIDASRDARTVESLLRIAQVSPVISLVGISQLTVRGETVANVLRVDQINASLSAVPRRYSASEVDRIYQLASNPRTWGIQGTLSSPAIIEQRYRGRKTSSTQERPVARTSSSRRATMNRAATGHVPTSNKSRRVAALLAFTLGMFGAHRLYARRWGDFAGGWGVIVVAGLSPAPAGNAFGLLLFLWVTVDLFRIATSQYRDGQGGPLI